MNESSIPSIETIPTPNPAKNLPATNNGISTEAVCRMTPKAKTHRPIQSAMRLPVQSATGAANRAPKSVPADRIDTIKDDSLEVMPS